MGSADFEQHRSDVMKYAAVGREVLLLLRIFPHDQGGMSAGLAWSSRESVRIGEDDQAILWRNAFGPHEARAAEQQQRCRLGRDIRLKLD